MLILRPVVFKIVALSAIAVLLLVTGCKKCYDCDVLYGSFTCYKGADSLSFYATSTKINDSLTTLTSMGYDCDTFFLLYKPSGYEVCGENSKNELEAKAFRCREQK